MADEVDFLEAILRPEINSEDVERSVNLAARIVCQYAKQRELLHIAEIEKMWYKPDIYWLPGFLVSNNESDTRRRSDRPSIL